jgi:hypothetical protein
MKIQIEKPESIVKLLKARQNRKEDKLTDFCLEGSKDELAEIQAANFELLLDACTEVGLTYVFVGHNEICGCERIVGPHPWPAIWRVRDILGIERCGGNTDQIQVNGAHIYFGLNRTGAWHVIERRRLTEEEEAGKEFFKVVTGRKGFEIPVY